MMIRIVENIMIMRNVMMIQIVMNQILNQIMVVAPQEGVQVVRAQV